MKRIHRNLVVALVLSLVPACAWVLYMTFESRTTPIADPGGIAAIGSPPGIEEEGARSPRAA